MSIENFCYLIKKIYENPFAQVEGLTAEDFYNLQEHVANCEECALLVNEVVEKYKDVPHNPKFNDGRYN